MEQMFCQSCGMPLINPTDYGTNPDHTVNSDYCQYCFQEGSFTCNCTMEEMIENNLHYLEEYNAGAGKEYSREEAAQELRIYLPTLKRWKIKKQTEEAWHEAINRVTDYLNTHLFEPIHLQQLSKIALLSSYHFHRIFKAFKGVSPGNYLQRLRLERIAYLLLSTSATLTELAEQSCYENKYALSKAFKKHFGISPSVYRKYPQSVSSMMISSTEEIICPKPEIRQMEERKIIYICLNHTERTQTGYRKAWEELKRFVTSNQLLNDKDYYLSFGYDDPGITQALDCRYYIGYTLSEKEIKPKGKLGIMSIPSGTYAIFRLKGRYEQLTPLYTSIYTNWLPSSDYIPADTFSYECYILGPDTTQEECITDVYIPVLRK